eukprot:15442829-Alexandrium_andersonii.AAC.1
MWRARCHASAHSPKDITRAAAGWQTAKHLRRARANTTRKRRPSFGFGRTRSRRPGPACRG